MYLLLQFCIFADTFSPPSSADSLFFLCQIYTVTLNYMDTHTHMQIKGVRVNRRKLKHWIHWQWQQQKKDVVNVWPEFLFHKQRCWKWPQWKYWRKNHVEGLKLVWGLGMSELCKANVYIIELHYSLNQFRIPNIAMPSDLFYFIDNSTKSLTCTMLNRPVGY